MREVGISEEAAELRHVISQQEIVVREVADDPTGRLAEGLVSVELAVPRTFREVGEPHPLVGEERLERRTRIVLHPVADDDHLDRGSLLVERAAERVRQEGSVAEGRNEDRRVGHETRASRRSSAIAETTAAPSAALDRGGGPPSR
jgi:hypothetical protein